MVKRPVLNDDEDNPVQSSSSSPQSQKRAKTETRKNHDRGDSDPEDELFEDQYRERILANLSEKRKLQGGVAEFGIIERIEMVNFMCHKFLKFEFGPQINFIIGGKSAVLSAITVALGGKSTSTGRGSGLKSFIKEGTSVAEVSIWLKNQGDEAYKPKEYGKSIIITRRFTTEGSTTWKIRGHNSKNLISTKKEEVSAICDHMNIQVDNPLNVLTQDAARQFLSASHPTDKYKFFLRGTQLSQLRDEYDTCISNIKSSHLILEQKKSALPELKRALKEATVRFDEAAKAREQKAKVDDLRKELAWAHVKSKEEELEKRVRELEGMKVKLGKITQSIDEAKLKFDAATEQVKHWEAKVEEFGNLDELTKEKDRLQGLIRTNRNIISDFADDLKKMDLDLSGINKSIAGLDEKIAAETARMAASTQAKHEETQSRLEAASRSVQNSKSNCESIAAQIRILQEHVIDATHKAGLQLESQRTQIKANIDNNNGMIQRARDAAKNRYVPYGNQISQVVEAIEKMKWVGEKPLGPLGLFVKAREPQVWGDLLRSQLGPFLTAFAVTDPRDRKQMQGLLDKSNNRETRIIIVARDMFDYSEGELPDGYLTILRALEISDPWALRILINVAHIESIVLAQKRSEAEKILRQLPGGGMAWTNDAFNVRVFPEGGASSTPLNMRSGKNNTTSLLLTGRDAASEVKHLETEIQTYQREHDALGKRINELRSEYAAGRQNIDQLKKEHAKADEQFRRSKAELANIQQEANDELPTNISSFENAKEECEAEKKSIIDQFQDVVRQKQEYDTKNKLLIQEQDVIKARINEFNLERNELVTQVQEAAEQRLKAQSSIDHYTKKTEAAETEIRQSEAIVEVVQEEFTNWTAKAFEYCERVPNPRKVEVVDRNLKSVTQALKEREQRHGASVEQMTIELNKAKKDCEDAERDFKQMTILNRRLKASVTLRLQRWQEFRRHIALRCKLVFGYHLSHRGYYGKVLFNHENQTLFLKVHTDDQAATQHTREKDPRSLSGGEKSFSTICLLLSLWESIGCPLRCLDEFDVFMDAVNRRISMKMMIDTANSSDKKQYILITPQDMGNVQLGPTVKVHRMTDPERTQAA